MGGLQRPDYAGKIASKILNFIFVLFGNDLNQGGDLQYMHAQGRAFD